MAVPSMPPVANGRAPNRSDRIPDTGPAIRKPRVSGSMAIPAHSGVTREVVAVQGQPDPLEPDDQHEHQPAAAEGGQEAGQHAGGEGPDLEQLETEHRLGTLVSMTQKATSRSTRRPPSAPSTSGLVHPIDVAAVGLDAVGDPDHDQDQPERRR